MLRILLVLILSPIIILAATTLVFGIIATGFEAIVKITMVAAILCFVRIVFARFKA